MSINYNVKIVSRIDTDVTDEAQALNIAKTYVKNIDFVNDTVNGENIITKLYYIAPSIGKFFVLVTDEDAKLLGVSNSVLANENIKNYPYIKLPNKIIAYKELIIKVGQNLSDEKIKNLAQAIADDAFEKVKPYQIPVVKVINYNTNESFIVMPSIFGDNVFVVDSNTVIQTDGDAEAGTNIINTFYITTEDNGITWYTINYFSLGADNDVARRKFFIGDGANSLTYFDDYILLKGGKSGDQGLDSPNEIQAPLNNLDTNKYVRILIELDSYDNYYKYVFKILDENDNMLFHKFSKGNGAADGIATPHKTFFYAYMPIIKEKAKYCFGESWGGHSKIKSIEIVDSLPTEDKTNGYINVKMF